MTSIQRAIASLVVIASMVFISTVCSGCSNWEIGIVHRDLGDTRNYHADFQTGDKKKY